MVRWGILRYIVGRCHGKPSEDLLEFTTAAREVEQQMLSQGLQQRDDKWSKLVGDRRTLTMGVVRNTFLTGVRTMGNVKKECQTNNWWKNQLTALASGDWTTSEHERGP